VRRALARPEQEPLSLVLRDGFHEELVPALWRRIAHSAPERRLAARAWLGLLAAALAVLCVTWLFVRRPVLGPLNSADGRAPRVLEASEQPLSAPFADGSRVDLSAGGRIEVLRNDERSFVVALRRGSGTFDVKPGGPRRWVIEAGLASVEVVGTRFEVLRTPERVRVSVERGVVVVRGETVPGGMVQLSAGKSLEVYGQPLAETNPLAPASALPAAPSLAPPLPNRRPEPVPSPAASTGDAIDALLASADAARRRGDDTTASAALEDVLRRAPERDPRRSLAALSLARLTAHGDPERAASALDEPAMQAMPEGLAEDALARRVQAEGQAGHAARAAALAAEYERRFPAGRHLEDVQRWRAP
jgi:transmembrane sensor